MTLRYVKVLYIFFFTVLGVLLQQVFHAVLELAIIHVLLTDFDKYSLGLSWDSWYTIHHVGTIILLLAGMAFGYWQGRLWWRIMYVEKRRLKHRSFRYSRE